MREPSYGNRLCHAPPNPAFLRIPGRAADQGAEEGPSKPQRTDPLEASDWAPLPAARNPAAPADPSILLQELVAQSFDGLHMPQWKRAAYYLLGACSGGLLLLLAEWVVSIKASSSTHCPVRTPSAPYPCLPNPAP